MYGADILSEVARVPPSSTRELMLTFSHLAWAPVPSASFVMQCAPGGVDFLSSTLSSCVVVYSVLIQASLYCVVVGVAWGAMSSLAACRGLSTGPTTCTTSVDTLAPIGFSFLAILRFYVRYCTHANAREGGIVEVVVVLTRLGTVVRRAFFSVGFRRSSP